MSCNQNTARGYTARVTNNCQCGNSNCSKVCVLKTFTHEHPDYRFLDRNFTSNPNGSTIFLNQLGDVNTQNLMSGDTLVFDQDTSTFIPGTVSTVQTGTGNPNTNGVVGGAGDVFVDTSTNTVYTFNGSEWVSQPPLPTPVPTTDECYALCYDTVSGTYNYQQLPNFPNIRTGTGAPTVLPEDGAGDIYVDTMNGTNYIFDGTNWDVLNPFLTGNGDPVITPTGGNNVYIDNSTGNVWVWDGAMWTSTSQSVPAVPVSDGTGDGQCFVLCNDNTAVAGEVGNVTYTPATLTVEGASAPTGTATTSVNLNLPDTLRLWNNAGAISVTQGSAVPQVETSLNFASPLPNGDTPADYTFGTGVLGSPIGKEGMPIHGSIFTDTTTGTMYTYIDGNHGIGGDARTYDSTKWMQIQNTGIPSQFERVPGGIDSAGNPQNVIHLTSDSTINTYDDDFVLGAPGMVAHGTGEFLHYDSSKTALLGGLHAGGDSTDPNVGQFSFKWGSANIASGAQSFAVGTENTSTGVHSHTMGRNNQATGTSSMARGDSSVASGLQSFASGDNATASGDRSHALGTGTTASSNESFASGLDTVASGRQSHAGGETSIASGSISFAHGNMVTAGGSASFATGVSSTASGNNSFVYGRENIASARESHAGGVTSTASGSVAFAHGGSVQATNINASAFGRRTLASGEDSHVIGEESTAAGNISFAGGRLTQALGERSFAFGESNQAQGDVSTAFGSTTLASGVRSFTHGDRTSATNENAVAFGETTTASGPSSSAFGINTVASGGRSFAHGNGSQATGGNSVAFGEGTTAGGNESLVHGDRSTASGDQSFAGGLSTTASGARSFAHGQANQALGIQAVSFGINNISLGNRSFTVGNNNQANGLHSFAVGESNIASGEESFAVNNDTEAFGQASFAGGLRCTASGSRSFVFGIDNQATTNNSAVLGGSANLASGVNSAILGGSANLASGTRAVAFGEGTTSSGENSFSMGDTSIASGKDSASMGLETVASGLQSFAQGLRNTASGDRSFSCGANNRSLGANSFSGGALGVAAGDRSFTFGNGCIAIGSTSQAFGEQTRTDGENATSFGRLTTASGSQSFVGGGGVSSNSRTKAFGRNDFAFGQAVSTYDGRGTDARPIIIPTTPAPAPGDIIANPFTGFTVDGEVVDPSVPLGGQKVILGRFGSIADSIVAPNYRTLTAGVTLPDNSVRPGFYIANGASIADVNNGANNSIGLSVTTVDSSGNFHTVPRMTLRCFQIIGGSVISSTGNADIAELFEAVEGQRDVGRFMTFSTETGSGDALMVRYAQPGEKVLGVISKTAFMIGNTSQEWNKKYLRDEFDDELTEEIKGKGLLSQLYEKVEKMNPEVPELDLSEIQLKVEEKKTKIGEMEDSKMLDLEKITKDIRGVGESLVQRLEEEKKVEVDEEEPQIRTRSDPIVVPEEPSEEEVKIAQLKNQYVESEKKYVDTIALLKEDIVEIQKEMVEMKEKYDQAVKARMERVEIFRPSELKLQMFSELYEELEKEVVEYLQKKKYTEEEIAEILNQETMEFPVDRKMNRDFDFSKQFQNREARDEWVTVGFSGRVIVEDDGKAKPGDRVVVGQDGKAVLSTDETGWIVLQRVGDGLEGRKFTIRIWTEQ